MAINRYPLLIIVLCSLLLVWARFDEFAVGSMADDAVYAELARSISEGRGPVLHVGPDEKSVTPTTQPSGYPLLISPVAYLFPNSLTALKLCSTAFFFAYLSAFYALLKPVTQRRERLAVVALIALNPWAIAYANRVFSESAYMLVSLAAVLCYDRWLRGRQALDLNLAGLVLGLAFGAAIRSIGFSLLLAVGLHLIYRRLWRRLGWWLPCQVACLALLMAYTRPSGEGFVPGSYLQQIVGFETSLLDRLVFMAWTLCYYLKELAALTLPVFGQAADAISTQQGLGGLYAAVAWTLGGLVLLGAIGGILRWRDADAPGVQLLWIYQLIFLGVLCNWTFIPVDRPGGWVELRLLLPLLPLCYLFAWGSLQTLGERLAVPNLAAKIPLLLLIAVLPLSLLHNAYRIKVPFRQARQASGRGFIDFATGSQWLRTHTDPQDVIMTSSRLERHIHYNRPTLSYGADWGQVDYVFIGPDDPNRPDALTPASARVLAELKGQPDRFELMRADAAKNWYIFRVVPINKN